MDPLINGVKITPLRRISNPKGDVWHAMKKSDEGYSGFGEVYFSTINEGQVKGWNRHKRMTINLVVPKGKVKFVLFDSRVDSATYRCFNEVILSPESYNRLTIPPNVLVGFKGLSSSESWIMNIANMEHDSEELEKIELKKISFDWA
tara:strand:- start:835 stop:1275 length:441 start_codon:yes stop_codon:yes gene_type:complete